MYLEMRVNSTIYIVVLSLSRVRLFATPWTAVCQASLSFTVSPSLPKFLSIEFGDAIQPSHPVLSPSPPAFNLSQHESFPISQFFPSGGQILELQLQHQSFQ